MRADEAYKIAKESLNDEDTNKFNEIISTIRHNAQHGRFSYSTQDDNISEKVIYMLKEYGYQVECVRCNKSQYFYRIKWGNGDGTAL